MTTFKEYLDNLRDIVKTEPVNDMEKGFRMAVALIYEHYKISKIK